MGKPIDDRFLQSYRELLDAEDAAFDDLEHATEDGDAKRFARDLIAWQEALDAKVTWLETCGYDLALPGRHGLDD